VRSRYDLIVVGGGPAGSTVAALAARAGLTVLLLEAQTHPRFHVGESLLPGIIPILDEMGALAEVEAAGFTKKTGSTHWNWGLTSAWDLWFSETEIYDHAWLVERARFDEILFHAAARAGAEVHEHAAARDFLFEGDRVVGVEWKTRGEGGTRCSQAAWTIDASGQAALLSRRLDLRSMIGGLQHHASFAHYHDAGRLPAPRAAQALLVAESRHWLWYFPLSETLTSVGVVFQEDYQADDDARRESTFEATVRASSQITDLLGPAARRVTGVYSLRDWSYRMQRVCGPGWLLAGDASGFIDPILSTGVFLGMHAAAQAARAVVAIARGAEEGSALAQYQGSHVALFGDVVRMVRFFYQRNLPNSEYFWESKRILSDLPDTELKPQRAFLALTSGLVRNLSLAEKQREIAEGREALIRSEGCTIDAGEHDPARLGWFCARLRHRRNGEPADLYLLLEPIVPASPTLFQTRNWHVNCLAPTYRNDVLRVPELASPVRAFGDLVRSLDVHEQEPLADFWRRTRTSLLTFFRGLPPELELVRIFGE
jgi:clorobiocin biosynthesis protein Clo-hal